MKVYLASDHAGFELKQKVKEHLGDRYEVVDCGADVLDPTDDYPVYIHKAVQRVAKEPESRAIIFGGSGQGEAMVANRYKGVRAAVYYAENNEILDLSREHNNANVLSIGARFVRSEHACIAVERWLTTQFSNDERHVRRLTQIDI
ncbi:MAG: RpiB/LacA/LacB family sugar-phosphate isomerase [bacterium]|nr:RpiB/LacA/LacB family sugar-phosphate isomerase [bacterium]